MKYVISTSDTWIGFPVAVVVSVEPKTLAERKQMVADLADANPNFCKICFYDDAEFVPLAEFDDDIEERLDDVGYAEIDEPIEPSDNWPRISVCYQVIWRDGMVSWWAIEKYGDVVIETYTPLDFDAEGRIVEQSKVIA